MESLSEELLENVLEYLFFLIYIFLRPNISMLNLCILGINPIDISEPPLLRFPWIVTQHFLKHFLIPLKAEEFIRKDARAVKKYLNGPLHPLVVPANHDFLLAFLHFNAPSD